MKYVLILLLVSCLQVMAQPGNGGRMGGTMEPGKISGILIDEKTKQPVEYGNIILFKFQDSTVATGGISNAAGEFYIEPVAYGKYFVKISFIGYTTKVIDNITVTPKSNDIDLETITLTPSGIKLDEVTVKSDREAYVNNLDKKVLNVDKMLTGSGGTAVDILQNAPAVTVDATGNVSMRGSSNLTILIDGKPSSMQGLSAADVLAQIPASSIESIELVTNPSAKYDPEGTGGIINIILKKKTNLGLNGVASANIGTEDKYNSSLNMNYRYMPFNFFASMDTRINNFAGTMDNNRRTSVNNTDYYLYQLSNTRNKMRNISGTFGLDYYAGDKTTFSFSVQTRNMNFDNYGSMNNVSSSPTSLINNAFIRKSDAERGINAQDYTLSFKQGFATKGAELTADIIFNNGKMKRDELINQIASSGNASAYTQKGVSDNSFQSLTFQSNYIRPFGKELRLETGFNLRGKNLDNNNDYSVLNSTTGNFEDLPSLRNYAENRERVYAVYGIFTGNWQKFKYQLGFRGEQATQSGKLLNTGDEFENKYTTVYPTIHAGYTFSDAADVLLSYSRRVDRPNNRQLNPFIDYTDSLNVIAGNPRLKPQFINSLELSGTFQVLFTTLMPSLYYRNTDNLISMITELRPGNVTYSTFDNIAKSSTIGMDLNIMQPLSRWWRLNLGFSGYRLIIKDSPLLSENVDNTTWNLKFSSNMNLPEDFQLQIMGLYNAAAIGANMGGFGGGGGGSTALAQTRMKPIYSVDAAVKKDFLEGKLSITLRISDIFNTRKFDTETVGENLLYISNRKMDSRMAFIGVSYRLDAKQFKQREREVKGEGGDEM